MFQKILLPVDGSEHSLRSTDKAIALAKLYHGTIDLLYVIDGSMSKYDVLHNDSKFEIDKKRKERLKPVEEKLTNEEIPFSTTVLHGEPGPTIVAFANERNYDCIVIGSRGLNQFQTLVLGSVSHKVMKRAECPVMIVK
ncbi:universal stress protein [Halalkalibacter urbisdiaboli]|uniref:universal stress protein n=1 Tax=Halalkalibacter urbisdiaboli TaxID=1960589 RepID=UPI000B44F612|nr:universal stress protein [Halalkalibacter urbisdiaboli]